MDNKSFDDLLKNSMETPRPIPFDEGAWNRLAKELPVPDKPSRGQKWRKFMPFTLALLALMSWNICLQQQVNEMKLLAGQSQKRDTIVEKQMIYQVDTIYQIIEKVNKIYWVNEEKGQETEIDKNDLITYKKFRQSLSKAANSSLDVDLSTPNLLLENGYTITPSLNLTPNNDFVSSFLNEVNFTNDENTETVTAITEKVRDVVAEATAMEKLEQRPIKNLKTPYSKINMDDAINWTDLNRPTMPKSFLEHIRIREFKIGLSNISTTDFGTNFSASFGLHLGANISRNWSLELDIAEVVGFNNIRPSGLYPNPYPHIDHELIPAHHQLQGARLNANYYQFSLGLRRIWFKKEHIRPYAEVGLIGYKLYEGDISYDYGVIGEVSFHPNIILDNKNYDMNWEMPAFIGAGLSTSLFKHRMSFDIGLRYIGHLNPNTTIYDGDASIGLGFQAALNYHF